MLSSLVSGSISVHHVRELLPLPKEDKAKISRGRALIIGAKRRGGRDDSCP